MRLTIELVTAVAMISRFRRWFSIAVGVLLLQRLREVAHQLLRQVRDPPARRNRAAAGTAPAWRTTAGPTAPAASGPGRAPCARRARRRDGRNSICAVEQALRFQRADEVLLGAEARHAHPLHQADRLVLAVVVVAAPARRPRRSSPPAACCAPRASASSPAPAPLSRILMLTSWSEVSTPAELSMKSVLSSTPCSAASMRPRWVRPRLPPSPTTLQRSSLPSTRNRVVGAVADVGVGLAAGLDVGADAAVPQQVDRRLEDRVHQLVRASSRRRRRRCRALRALPASPGSTSALRG